MFKKICKLLSVLPLAVVLLMGFSCATTAEPQDVDAVAHATPKGSGWMVELKGVRSDELWESGLQEWIEENPELLQTLELEKRGEIRVYEAVPLKIVVAMVDDPDGGMPYSFQQDLWGEGYDLTAVAEDGYSVTLNTGDVAADDLFIAMRLNGEAVTPTLVGHVSSQYWVRDLSRLELGLEPVALDENPFELQLAIGDQEAAYTLAQLEAHPAYTEDKGNYTNSYGNNFQHLWGGVKFVDLINEYTTLAPDMTVTIQAMDGYEMDYSGAQLLDQEEGVWVLAFKEDGAYMPEDPGYIRLVKVGPNNPEITGHVSARMVKKIIIQDVPFEDFKLELVNDGTTEVMDKQTLKSGVTTHRSKVNFYDRKNDRVVSYMGLPLFEMFSHFPGYTRVTVEAADGFSITLSADELEGNQDVILAMYYGDGSELSEREKPLLVAWDKDASLVPAGIKPVRQVVRLIVE